MRLFHFSNRRMLTRVRQARQFPSPEYKPEGLWLSVGDHWHRWCSADDPGWKFKNCWEVVLRPDAKILRISKAAELTNFQRQFGDEASQFYRGIFWSEVAKEFDGILISPVQRRWRELGAIWYYSWDVASGAIWGGPRAIESIIPIDFSAVPRYEEVVNG